jgi:hypothetical protein
MRPKVASIHDLDEQVTDLATSERRRKHAEAQTRKLWRRLVIAILLGIAGTIGAGLGAEALIKMGLPVPEDGPVCSG